MSRKGQVTLFVILGIIILLVVGIFVYINNRVVEVEPPVDPSIKSSYDARLDAVALSIERCLGFLARDFLEDAGVTGGFYGLDSRLYRYDLYPEYTNNAVELFPGSGLVVPYWFSINSPPDCVDCAYQVNHPVLEGDFPGAISYDLERYVEDNIVGCVDDFSAYDDVYDITYGVPSARVNFYEDATSIGLLWDLEARVHGSDLTLSAASFVEDMDLRMKKMYDLALDVLYQVVISRNALDEFTRSVSDVMGMGQDPSVPPRAGGVSYERGAPHIWRVSEAKESIREAVSDNIMYVQVLGSREHFIMLDDDDLFRQNFYSGFLHSLFTDSDYLGDTSIRFSYWPDWPFYLDVNPSMGDIVMPSTYAVRVPLLSFSITNYDFSYDIAHPVLITLEDASAFGGDGYVFQFAVESNIRSSNLYSAEPLDIDVPEQDEFVSGFTDPLQRTIPVEIEVVELGSYERLNNISVSYTCIDQTIIVGRTEARNQRVYLESYMPPCIDGYFEIMSDEYYSDETVESVVSGEDNSFVIEAFKETEIDFDVRKRHVARSTGEEVEGIQEYEWHFNPAFLSVLPDEEIFILFTRVADGQPTDFVRAVELERGVSSGTVSLIPGEYDLMIISMLHLDEELVLEDEVLCVNDECHTIEGAVFNDTIMAGYLLLDDSTSGRANITRYDLSQDRMTMYYTGFRLGEVEITRHLEVFGALVEASEDQRTLLLPLFE